MATLAEDLASRYAAAVHRVVADEFPRLDTETLRRIVVENVARQAEAPMRSFELIVDEPVVANWKLVPDHTGDNRWRVQILCCKQRPSHANAAREQRINAALRAIKVEV